ncbi:arylamine N-acetyltransferase [Halobaculum sp. MBLA0147]|uniref:arylamine N-acetyltransferase family protein n=1 Tax=Halobaculum sp. MBLA0147 TaxID=3079934 RepID=UPI00352344A8
MTERGDGLHGSEPDDRRWSSDDERVTTYLERIGLDSERVRARRPNHDLLTDLLRAHVTAVPFETLSITGDPFGEWPGPGVSLTVPALYEKVVARERGGYCFELGGLFTVLLRSLGFRADRAAGMVLGDGETSPTPANHHTVVVHLDRRYVADVGTGLPKTRVPVPLDGESVRDDRGTEWRVADSSRPDSEYRLSYRRPGDEQWERRYVFDATPRPLSYFAASCDYLATAAESPFTGEPTLSVATADGAVELSPTTLTRHTPEGTTTESLSPEEWAHHAAETFGLRYPFLDGAE